MIRYFLQHFLSHQPASRRLQGLNGTKERRKRNTEFGCNRGSQLEAGNYAAVLHIRKRLRRRPDAVCKFFLSEAALPPERAEGGSREVTAHDTGSKDLWLATYSHGQDAPVL